MLPTGHLLLWITVYIRSNLYFPSVHVAELGNHPDPALLSNGGPVYKRTVLLEGLAAGPCFLANGNHQSKNAHKLISVEKNKLLLIFFSFWSTYEAFLKLTLYGRDSVCGTLALWHVVWTQQAWDRQESQVDSIETFQMFLNILPPEKRSNIHSQLSTESLEWHLHILGTLGTLSMAEQQKRIQGRVISSPLMALKKTINPS